MKILTLTYEYPPLGGGGGKVAQGLAEHLVANGHDVDVITMGYKDLPKLEEHGEKDKGKLTIMRLAGIRSKTESCHMGEMLPHEIYTLFRASKLIRRNNYDLIHAHFLFPDGFAARILASIFKLPLMVTAHGSDVPGYNPDRFKLLHVLLNPIWHFTVKGVTRIVSPSQHLISLIKKEAENAPTQVIPNGFDPSKFRTDRPRQARVLVVTRLFQRKGVQYILQAAAKLKQPVEVHVVGDGHYLDALKQLDAELGTKAKFWGWLDNNSEELKELYETSSIFAFTSDQENFPINLLEAMCAGNAIITTDSSGTSEVVGDTAIIVPRQDPEAIREALENFLESPEFAAEMGQKARARLDENFSWQAVTKRYEESMQEMIDEFESAHS